MKSLLSARLSLLQSVCSKFFSGAVDSFFLIIFMKLHCCMVKELTEPNICRKFIFTHVWVKKAPN